MAKTRKELLVDSVIREASVSVQTDPKLVENSNFQLNAIVVEAISQHDPVYDIDELDTTADAYLPVNEEPLIVLLSLIRVARIRAQSWANQANTTSTQAQWGRNADTPFEKNMKLAKMLRDEYELRCSELGLTFVSEGQANTGVVVVSNARCPNSDHWETT